MKTNLCDFCLVDKVIMLAPWSSGYPRAKLHVCVKHRSWAKGISYNEALQKFLEVTVQAEDFLISQHQLQQRR